LANNFINAKKDLTTTDDTTIYTCPTATQSVVKSILVNDDSGSGSTLNLTLTSGTDVFSIYKTKSISANETVELLTQPLIIQESEILKGQAGNANRLHVIVSLMEKT
jgi:hypothetical protein|tara:strand:+ start:262 stop:582 length:321 start_codon:yes stop_codon:yes gene_type:complete